MPTTGVINGTAMRLSFSDEKLIHPTNCSLSLSAEIREIVSKDNDNGYSDGEIGQKSATISFDGFYSQDDEISSDARADVAAIFALYNAGNKFNWKISTGVTGDDEFSGQCLITSFEMSHPVQESGTYSGTATVIGAVAIATIS